jgi:hypothetical protein
MRPTRCTGMGESQQQLLQGTNLLMRLAESSVR